MKSIGVHKMFLSIYLAIAIILSGMCFENIATDSFVQSVDSANVMHHSSVSDNVLNRNHLCAGELLGVHDGINLVNHTQRMKGQSGKKTILTQSFSKHTPDFSFKMPKSTYRLADFEVCCREVIICYIHHQDGAKG